MVTIPETSIGADTGEPTEVFDQTTHPLIDSGDVVVAIVLVGVPTQIKFQTVVGVEAMLP